MRAVGIAAGMAAALALWAGAVAAQGWSEPARGSTERRAIMDALRPFATQLFGAPVEFVVRDLRVAGDVAFAAVAAQRPGGGAIDVARTPGWATGYFLPEGDWTYGQALLWRGGAGWVVDDWLFGATDVWWSEPRYCAAYRPVIADVCG